MLKANAVIQALNSFSRWIFSPLISCAVIFRGMRVFFEASWYSCFMVVVSEQVWSSRLPWLTLLTRKVTPVCLISAKLGEQNVAFRLYKLKTKGKVRWKHFANFYNILLRLYQSDSISSVNKERSEMLIYIYTWLFVLMYLVKIVISTKFNMISI